MFVIIFTYAPLDRAWGPFTEMEAFAKKTELMESRQLPGPYFTIIRMEK